jgi:hypothetical protein
MPACTGERVFHPLHHCASWRTQGHLPAQKTPRLQDVLVERVFARARLAGDADESEGFCHRISPLRLG